MTRYLLRVVLVAYALAFLIPMISGITFKGDWLAAFSSSLVFTTVFTAIEWLLGVLIFGINVGTLGIGVIITSGLKFVVSLLAPSAALYGTAKLMPQFIGLTDVTPTLLAGGLLLGGLLFATSNSKNKKQNWVLIISRRGKCPFVIPSKARNLPQITGASINQQELRLAAADSSG